MGIEVAAGVMAAVSVASRIGQMGADYSAAEARKSALDLQSKQQFLEHQQKTLSNYDILEKVIAAQNAQMTIRGTAFSSPSFNAIQRSTMNIGSKRQRNIDIEDDLSAANIEIEKKNVRNTLFAKLFTGTAQTAEAASGFFSKMPTMKS